MDPSSKRTLNFTNFEYNFINLINLYLTHHNQQYPHDKIVCRIAGGWVRDKILDIPSNDIDIAIENQNVSGQSFLQNLVDFYKQDGNVHIKNFNNIHKTNFKFKQVFNTGIHATKVNPEKSKHLETAMATIFDHSIDFVSLRKEVYKDENSRIPTIEVGTPLEDCLRRDCTINSLFYNINTGYLEDLSKNGLMDLQNGIIRTPLEPMKTFTDDPLRIFRLFRFKNKLGFQYSRELVDCFKENHDLLVDFVYKKVSRERVAIEVNKILNTNNAEICKNFLNDLNYFGFTKFFYSNNKTSYEDELKKRMNESDGKIVNQKKKMLADKIILHQRTLDYFEHHLPSQIDFIVKTIQQTKNIKSYKLDMASVVHANSLYPLLDLRLQYDKQNKERNLLVITKDMELALLSNGIVKAKVKQIIALAELLDLVKPRNMTFDVDEDGDFTSRAELCIFVKERMVDNEIYKTFRDMLKIFYPEIYTNMIKNFTTHKIIKNENDDLDRLWGKENMKLLWNGGMLAKHVNKKPGPWMTQLIAMQWTFFFEKELDIVKPDDLKLDDFISWVDLNSNFLNEIEDK